MPRCPGTKLLVGVHLAHEEAWHTYWRNSGESGYATTVAWQLPAGVTAGPLQWPAPHEYPDAAGFVTYGYGDDILLLSELSIPAGLSGELKLAAQVDWLMCRELCIPDTAQIELTLPVRDIAQPVEGADAELFAASQARLPQTQLAGIELAHALELKAIPPGQPTYAVLRVRGLADAASAKWTWFPLEHDSVLPERAQGKVVGDELLIQVPFEIDSSQSGGVELVWGGVLELNENGTPRWIQPAIALAIASEGAAIAANEDPILSAYTGLALDAESAPQRGFLVFLFFAFVGGIILNVMPCVLPVLSLKVMGFVSHAGESRGAILRLGLLFTLGVLISFLALALVVIGIQAAGEQLGWGFQFQNPVFVVVMAAIVFAFGLSLFGVYEIMLPIGFGGGSRAHGAGAESFVSGVLATALATPCTAPFLGSALGFAFTQPWYGVLAIFLTVGLGLAAPYMVLAANPGWLRFVPKPGAWMERFKQAMGFLLMATLIWLLWVLSRQMGAEAVIWTLAFLCALGLGLWLYGAFVNLSSSNARRYAFLALLVAITAGSAVGFLREPLSAPIETAANGAVAHGDWRRFDRVELAAAVDGGKTVFLDFTADWCTTCKVNEKTVLETEEIRAKFAELDVVKMVGDYTRRDPEITQMLRSFGRSGVPLYVVYPAGRLSEPIVLPEVITKAIVLRALEAAGPSRIDTASTLGQSARRNLNSEDER